MRGLRCIPCTKWGSRGDACTKEERKGDRVIEMEEKQRCPTRFSTQTTRGKAWVRVCTVDQEDYISAEILVNTTVIGQTAHFFLKQTKYEWKFPF